MKLTELHLRRLFNRRTARTLMWMLLVLALAAAANVLGIYLFGSIAAWETWMRDHAGYFLVWRLLLYAMTIYGWLWMRRRLLAREPDHATRLRCAELAAVAAITLLEAGTLLQFQ
jgi:hypothetical protein